MTGRHFSGSGDTVVLVVEDHAAMRALVRDLIAPESSEIVECHDGDEALACYDALHPDWVLMDISLPGTDGIAATRRIRAAHPEARIAIVTDHGDEGHRRAAAEAGALAFVRKDSLLGLPALLRTRPDAVAD